MAAADLREAREIVGRCRQAPQLTPFPHENVSDAEGVLERELTPRRPSRQSAVCSPLDRVAISDRDALKLTLERLALGLVALRMKAHAVCDIAAVECLDPPPAGRAQDLGAIALPVRVWCHEPRPITASASLVLPGLDAQGMKAELPSVVELGDVLHAGDR